MCVCVHKDYEPCRYLYQTRNYSTDGIIVLRALAHPVFRDIVAKEELDSQNIFKLFNKIHVKPDRV